MFPTFGAYEVEGEGRGWWGRCNVLHVYSVCVCVFTYV